MKNAAGMMVNILIGVILLLILLTVKGRENRSVEIKNTLPAVIEETLYGVLEEENLRSADEKEEKTKLLQSFVLRLDSDSDVTIKTAKADLKRGILAMEAIEGFYHPNGKAGKVLSRRTAIVDRIEETEKKTVEVKFYLSKASMLASEIPYKSVCLRAGDMLMIPVNPRLPGKLFASWQDENDYICDFSVPVEENRMYYALWK